MALISTCYCLQEYYVPIMSGIRNKCMHGQGHMPTHIQIMHLNRRKRKGDLRKCTVSYLVKDVFFFFLMSVDIEHRSLLIALFPLTVY